MPNIEQLAALGYDYVELYLASLAALPDGEFQAVVDRLGHDGDPMRGVLHLLPAHRAPDRAGRGLGAGGGVRPPGDLRARPGWAPK